MAVFNFSSGYSYWRNTDVCLRFGIFSELGSDINPSANLSSSHREPTPIIGFSIKSGVCVQVYILCHGQILLLSHPEWEKSLWGLGNVGGNDLGYTTMLKARQIEWFQLSLHPFTCRQVNRWGQSTCEVLTDWALYNQVHKKSQDCSKVLHIYSLYIPVFSLRLYSTKPTKL